MRELHIDLSQLGQRFLPKPLLIGGKAMEYYGLRKAGNDIDFVVSAEDHRALVQKYPGNVKDIHGDIGVCVNGFEMWNRICLFDYVFLLEGSVEAGDICVAHLHKLLFLKALAMGHQRYRRDLELIVQEILNRQYTARGFDQQSSRRCPLDRNYSNALRHHPSILVGLEGAFGAVQEHQFIAPWVGHNNAFPNSDVKRPGDDFPARSTKTTGSLFSRSDHDVRLGFSWIGLSDDKLRFAHLESRAGLRAPRQRNPQLVTVEPDGSTQVRDIKHQTVYLLEKRIRHRAPSYSEYDHRYVSGLNRP
jgi:hypothetical protein